jgi:hypothetical protein
MFFLTAADTERLQIRGSRDPLGLIPVWGFFGRQVIRNLTTASNSVRGFTTLLIGLHLAERVAERGANLAVSESRDREKSRLQSFLMFEQLAAYARVLGNKDESMRGITRVKARLNDDARHVRVGYAPEFQILSNQKTYGIWGLFIRAAIESGIITSDLTLTESAQELFDNEYRPILLKHGADLEGKMADALGKASVELDSVGKHKTWFDALAAILDLRIRRRERAFYHTHLVMGGPTAVGKWQPLFAELAEGCLPATGPFTHETLATVIKAATKKGEEDLATHLSRIRDLEQLIVAIDSLFAFLQHRDNNAVAKVIEELKDNWGVGLRHLDPDSIASIEGAITTVYDNADAGKRFVALAQTLYAGAYAKAIDHLLEHNAFVMAARSGAPWIRKRDARLDVRYRDEIDHGLLPRKELPTRWRSTFYLDPFKLVSDELRADS